jgi:hypothetical protein
MASRSQIRIVVRRMFRIAAYAWAGVYTLVGLAIGVVALLSGATARRHGGIVEFGGGGLGRWMSRFRPPFVFTAITFGHVVIGIDDATLACARAHELVHVRQYERWGPLFVPLYLLSSFVQLVRGRRPYLDNAFEREARDGDAQAIACRRTSS